MPDKITIDAEKDHVLHRTALLRFYRKERGETKTRKGYMIPLTTRRDIVQLVKWWDAEYRRARARKRWHKDPIHDLWKRAKQRISRDIQGADPEAVYPGNEWFWNIVLLKLAIHLEVLKTSPSPTELMIESLRETVEERLDDAKDLFDNAGETVIDFFDAAGDAAGALADMGERAWSGIKVAAIVGGSLVGAAIVLPPVVRAFRNDDD